MRPARARYLASLMTLLLAACPAPIAHTTTFAPPLEGTLLGFDGTPARGVRVVVSAGYADGSCLRPLGETTTDTAGAFHFAAIRKTYRVLWIYPGDVAVPLYDLCIGVGDTLRFGYEGAGSLSDGARPETLRCIEWQFSKETRVACDSDRRTAIVSGGRWVQGDTSGFFRLILTPDPAAPPGAALYGTRLRAYVLWVAQPGNGSAASVQASRRLPGLPEATRIDEPRIQLLPHGGWCASVRVSTPRSFRRPERDTIAISLGQPGELQSIKSCP